jgi:hypothetical protein
MKVRNENSASGKGAPSFCRQLVFLRGKKAKKQPETAKAKTVKNRGPKMVRYRFFLAGRDSARNCARGFGRALARE